MKAATQKSIEELKDGLISACAAAVQAQCSISRDDPLWADLEEMRSGTHELLVKTGKLLRGKEYDFGKSGAEYLTLMDGYSPPS